MPENPPCRKRTGPRQRKALPRTAVRLAELPAREAAGQPTVLVVDHEPMLRQAISAVLRRLGCEPLEASSAVEARELAARRKKIDLLFVDFSTPENNGLELVRWFQTIFPKTRAVITTDSLWELLYQTGQPEQYVALAKPFSDEELGRIIQKTLGTGETL